jgi:hypothetical protein
LTPHERTESPDTLFSKLRVETGRFDAKEAWARQSVLAAPATLLIIFELSRQSLTSGKVMDRVSGQRFLFSNRLRGSVSGSTNQKTVIAAVLRESHFARDNDGRLGGVIAAARKPLFAICFGMVTAGVAFEWRRENQPVKRSMASVQQR